MLARLRLGATGPDGVDPAADLSRLVAGIDKSGQARVGTVMAPTLALRVVRPDFVGLISRLFLGKLYGAATWSRSCSILSLRHSRHD